MGTAPINRGGPRELTQTRAPTVSLMGWFPDVFAVVADDDRELAERALVAQRLFGCDEDLAGVLAGPSDVLGFLILDGVVLKETTLATRSALELLSVGDLLAPPLSEPQQRDSRAVSRYLAHGPVSLAVLGARFRAASRRWPAFGDEVHDRFALQAHRASAHVAMLHVSRLDSRIALLFADLSERCGRMTPDGIVIDISLTHELIGRLTGARRPTVSLALQALSDAGTLRRVGKERWMLPRAVRTA